RPDTSTTLRIIDAPLYEEVNVFRRHNLVIKPIRFFYKRIIYVKQSLISDTLYRVVKSILYELFDGSFRQEFQFAFLVNPVNYDFLRSKCFAARLYHRLLHLIIEPFRLFLSNNINELDSEKPVYLLLFRRRFNYVRHAFKDIAVLVKRHNN